MYHLRKDIFLQSHNLTITLKKYKPGMLVQTCNPSTWEAEAGGSQVPRQLEQHSESLSRKRKKREREGM
jgi:hypothetical protein